VVCALYEVGEEEARRKLKLRHGREEKEPKKIIIFLNMNKLRAARAGGAAADMIRIL
jgi:hypothetical protein